MCSFSQVERADRIVSARSLCGSSETSGRVRYAARSGPRGKTLRDFDMMAPLKVGRTESIDKRDCTKTAEETTGVCRGDVRAEVKKNVPSVTASASPNHRSRRPTGHQYDRVDTV